MTTITHHYNTLPQNASVMGPYNTRYNSKWVLRCGDVHPNPGHCGIYHLRRDCRLVPRPPVLLLDKENYPQHLLVNTNRQYDNVDKAAEGHDRDMKLATWNIQGAQGTVILQRWANTLHLIQQCRIDLCGIQEYNLGFRLPEAATTPLNNDYKCYTAPGTETKDSFPCPQCGGTTRPRNDILPQWVSRIPQAPATEQTSTHHSVCLLRIQPTRQTRGRPLLGDYEAL